MAVLGLALIVLATPSLLNASEFDNARMAAERDAGSDVSMWLWLGAGCLFNLLGVGAAYVIVPSPPASRLLGKSNEYIAAYTDMYKESARGIQVKNALIGCGISSVGYVLYWVFVVLIFGGSYWWVD
jgi:hypothetical protein